MFRCINLVVVETSDGTRRKPLFVRNCCWFVEQRRAAANNPRRAFEGFFFFLILRHTGEGWKQQHTLPIMDIAHDFIADVVGADRQNPISQAAIFYGILTIGGLFFYQFFALCSFTYFFVLRRHQYFPPTIKRVDVMKQALHEIWIGSSSLPFMGLVMLPCPLFAYRGYSKMYTKVDDYGWGYLLVSIVLFLVVTDCVIYWAHRGLHHPLIYKPIHKLHHTYKFTTPFSSHAFHPLDGFTQGVPYYMCAYLFPIHNLLFVALFVCVNFWTISIHDQVDFGPGEGILNTTGHHTIHHELFNYNYGQYTTIWDRIGGTYRIAEQTHDFATGRPLPNHEPPASPNGLLADASRQLKR